MDLGERPQHPEHADERRGQKRKGQPARHRDGDRGDDRRQDRHPDPQRRARLEEVGERQTHQPGIEPVQPEAEQVGIPPSSLATTVATTTDTT